MNNQIKLRKALPERLRSLGLDEAWLQEQIARDSSLLGLGELELIKKEKSQPSGGRLDFLMGDPEGEIRYEIEVMLGEVDSSHIIRAIEYWDIERQRYPTLEHRAVIVAEEITSRFFNVIRLLNRAIPMIAIQLSAFRLEDEVILQFIRVLDTYEFGAEPEDDHSAEPVDRSYWDKKASRESLAVVDLMRALIPSSAGEPKVTYNRYHIALGTTGYNFCWFYPRKAAYCPVHIKVKAEMRADIVKQLDEAGIEASTQRSSLIILQLNSKDLQDHRDLLTTLMRTAEDYSHR